MELAPGYKAEGRSKGAWGGVEYPANRVDYVANEAYHFGEFSKWKERKRTLH